jgi:hypothetical protein
MSLTWPPELSLAFEQKSGELSRRAQELLWYMEYVHTIPCDAMPEITFDSHMSITWAKACEGRVPCLASTSRIWCLRRGCLLPPSTYMELQGFPSRLLCDPPADGSDERLTVGRGPWTKDELIDLAGNAFNGGVCCAAVTLMMLGVRSALANLDGDRPH